MIRLFTYAFLLFLPSLLLAQNTWSIETGNANSGLDGIQTTDGGFVTVTNNPWEIMKVNQNGQLQWIKTWNSAAFIVIHALIETSDQGLAVLGTTSNGDNTLLIRMDANANVLWEKEITLFNSPLQADWLCPTHDDGGLLLGGGECTLHRYVIRLDNQGNEVFLRQYEGFANFLTGIFWNVVQAPGSGYVLTYNRIDNGDMDVGVMKIDENGDPLWAKYMDEGAAGDQVNDMIPTANGGFACMGATSNYPPNCQKLTLSAWDGSGNLLFYKVYTDSVNFNPMAFVQTQDGGFLMTGMALGAGIIVIKTDATGNIQWQGRANHSNSMLSYALANAPGDRAYIAGWDLSVYHFIAQIDVANGLGMCGLANYNFQPVSAQAPLVVQNPTWTPGTVSYATVSHPPTNRNAEAVLVCGQFGTAVTPALDGLTVGPNPFGNRFSVRLGQAAVEGGTADLLDLHGRVIGRKAIAAGTRAFAWDLSESPSGLLLLRLSIDGGTHVQRLVRMGE